MGIVFRDPDEEGLARYISDVTADGAAWDDDGYPQLENKLSTAAKKPAAVESAAGDDAGASAAATTDGATTDRATTSATDRDDKGPQA